MKALSSREIREIFIRYFEKKNHLQIPPSPLVPKNDPTLLFINSGMAPLKKYFLGKATPPAPMLCNFQPCIRTKDIDDVGDRHHLTLFEMLGSWSIGDYYKQGAVELAFELLVDHFGFDVNRLYVTVYNGDPKKGLAPDDESAGFWEKVGIAKDHIIALGEDNFWGPAGDTGPCGPCTEVFYDTGEEFGEKYVPGKEFDTTKRYIEIWNAGVFMQYNKTKDGKYEPLPLKSVDTGSGLERMAMVMNGLGSAYETDLLKPIMDFISGAVGNSIDISGKRIITDHIKASTFILSEGVLPSNEGAGYVPRRLIRKIVTLATNSGKKLDYNPMIESVIQSLKEYYPHLETQKKLIMNNFNQEVKDFEPVIQNGLKLLEKEMSQAKNKTLSGKTLFELSTTHGVPVEIVKEEVRKKGLKIDLSDYEKRFEEHQKISRQGTGRGNVQVGKDDLSRTLCAKDVQKTTFTGYEKFSDTGKILNLACNGEKVKEVKEGDEFFIAFDQTCFYAESGGQVGDTGTIKAQGEALVLDTQKVVDVFVLKAKMLKGSLKLGDKCEQIVDSNRRIQIRRNHSATHLMHTALRTLLGDHVQQKGSHVDEQRLRFDFQHPKSLTSDEIRKIENFVNELIRKGSKNNTQVMKYDDAIETGALAFFGDTYGEKVRVVQFGKESVEFCGGIHVENTGEIGLFTITSESSVAKGVRRIEAITSQNALEYLQDLKEQSKRISEALGAPQNEIIDRIALLKKKASGKDKAVTQVVGTAKDITEFKLKNHLFVTARLDADGKAMKETAENILNQHKASAVLLFGIFEDMARVVVVSDKKASKEVPAQKIIQPFLDKVEGRGGGKPIYAQGGGKNVAVLPELLKNATQYIESAL